MSAASQLSVPLLIVQRAGKSRLAVPQAGARAWPVRQIYSGGLGLLSAASAPSRIRTPSKRGSRPLAQLLGLIQWAESRWATRWRSR